MMYFLKLPKAIALGGFVVIYLTLCGLSALQVMNKTTG